MALSLTYKHTQTARSEASNRPHKPTPRELRIPLVLHTYESKVIILNDLVSSPEGGFSAAPETPIVTRP